LSEPIEAKTLMVDRPVDQLGQMIGGNLDYDPAALKQLR
jgi:hypothetical protein